MRYDQTLDVGDYVHVLMRIAGVDRTSHPNIGTLVTLVPCSTIEGEEFQPIKVYWQRLEEHIKPEDMPYDGTE